MTATHRFYKIMSGDKGGSGSFLCPPGHPRHHYSLWEYESPRHRHEIGIGAIDNALAPEADASPALRARVQKIMDEAVLVPSEMWIRSVYGYFRYSYAPEDMDRNVSRAITHNPAENPVPITPERHLAVLCVREYFPDHEPRLDLIDDPGNGYGGGACVKCGDKVQYEERVDKLCVVSTRMVGMTTHWTRNPECPKGGDHEV